MLWWRQRYSGRPSDAIIRSRMPGHRVSRTWQHDPTLDAPARYRRACRYEAFVPDELSSLPLHLDAPLVGLVSEAEHAIRQLKRHALTR